MPRRRFSSSKLGLGSPGWAGVVQIAPFAQHTQERAFDARGKGLWERVLVRKRTEGWDGENAQSAPSLTLPKPGRCRSERRVRSRVLRSSRSW